MSTSTSKPILELKNVNLVFRTELHRPWTWRDVFARTAKDPIGALLSEKDRLHLLKNISLRVHPGERVALIGVNGTGKTTLCRCIAGIYQPTGGTICVRGGVRAIFDTAVGILPDLTGRENAHLLAEFMYPGDAKQRHEIVEEALEFSELGRFVDMPFRFYSNGMQARLCLSLISSRPADLLVLDEVFEGADHFFQEKISRRIVRLIEASGAVIFVSHSPDQVTRVCNRLLLIREGEIVYDGGVEEGMRTYLSVQPQRT